MRAIIYMEGGGDSRYLDIRCREGFHKLLEKCGFSGRMPKLRPWGGRFTVFRAFSTELRRNRGRDYVAMWIDSEEPMADIEKAWDHLQNVTTVPTWSKPKGASDDQVLFMTTCMETWIVADRDALRKHYDGLQESALPPVVDLEQRDRHDVQEKLSHATRNCLNAYAKGKRSFESLARLAPAVLEQHLPSFARVRRILRAKL